jgi:RNA polymerase sigma-70 factor
MMIDPALLERLYRAADAARWSVPAERFQEALQASLQAKGGEAAPSRRELERHLESLHLRDLALACGCAAGNDRAWEHFVAEYRPHLYRAADALSPGGGARELADALYADLYGLGGESGSRASLFRYFHGRSSLATWLRAVLAQRYVDQLRAGRRTAMLDDATAIAIPTPELDPEQARYTGLMGEALRDEVARLTPMDRLRLRAYYEQDLTLSQVGRLTGEHESTVSRQLARTRRTLRDGVERRLRGEARLGTGEIACAIEWITADAGTLDLRTLFGAESDRKISAFDRSE